MLLFLLVLFTGRDAYLLSDIQYPLPSCAQGGVVVRNNFGRLLLDNDLLATRLNLRVEPDSSQSSCRFCGIATRYCTTPFGNGSDLHLAYDTSYNLRLISVDGLNRSVSGLSVALPATSGGSVSIERSRQVCGTTYRLVLLVVMQSEAPLVRDFLLIASASATRNLPCSAEPSQADLSCRLAPTYYYVDYTVGNCVTAGPSPLVPPTRTHTYVYYYQELFMLEEGSLCGERWVSIYRRTHLETYCKGDNTPYIRLKPWYEAALRAVAAWSDGRRDTSVWLALETLEQYCEVRELVLPLFTNMTLLLGGGDDKAVERDWALLCEGDGTSSQDNVTLPFYFYHHGAWYFESFKYLIYFDEAMPLKTGLFVAFCVLSGLCVLAGTLLTLRRLLLTYMQTSYERL
jgi:hypothetical protein